MTNYKIIDWAGNTIFSGMTWPSFDEAESHLCEFLNDLYESDREEYYVVEEIER